MPVKTWGDYEVDFDRILGRGGMGAVYMGRQVSVDRPAAIKLLKKELTQDPSFVRRFHREASLVARLVDPHIVQVFGAGEADGQHFYAMEYVQGEDLARRLKRGERFGPDLVLRVAQAVGQALASAWKHKIVHRDIKPSNIVVTVDGAIKVLDFGLAKSQDVDLTVSDAIMGTAKYMSPEQAQGEAVDVRSDLYSLGVVLYELTVGAAPFQADTPTAMMYKHAHEKPRPPRELDGRISPELDALIMRLLAKDPAGRFPNPEALLSAVKAVQDGVSPEEKSTLYNETVRVTPPSAATPLPAPRRSSGLALGLSLGLAGALVAAGGYFLVQAAMNAPPSPAGPAAALRPPPPPPASSAPSPPIPPWREPADRGLDALGRGEFGSAAVLLEEAARLGAPELGDKILQAKVSDLVARGDALGDDPARALEAYEAARALSDTEAIRRKIARVSFERWSRSARKGEGGDWKQAAADWARALPFADPELHPQIEARRRFCETYAEAVRARVAGDWPKAAAAFEELAKDPREYAASIDVELRRAREETARMAEAALAARRREFDAVVEEVRTAHRRAAWAEAKAALERTREAKYAEFPRDGLEPLEREIGRALAAPPGMVYVPGGAFRMGGGREVEGPAEGDAATGPFYLDDRETTVAEYAEFLSALGESGHHAGCPKDEPAGKRHDPDGFSGRA
ncbi:MAG TPA: bifunctional serine/threonine-protein kinase/formylglycine-generating enzyme family protein, partial [Planctomycetota bacterium]|nr:bifunctional serine/threonine-protein kinase/formylglycine-generating enzyme family protein [Planctomycetota bacterium]